MKKSVRIRKMDNSGGIFPWPWNTIFLAICIVVVSAFVYMIFNVEPGCNESDIVILKGTLKGFDHSDGYWHVQLDSEMFNFNRWDKGYMPSFVGHHVELKCCCHGKIELQNSTKCEYYDMLSCFID